MLLIDQGGYFLTGGFLNHKIKFVPLQLTFLQKKHMGSFWKVELKQ